MSSITNGGFETGTTSGWTQVNLPSGAYATVHGFTSGFDFDYDPVVGSYFFELTTASTATQYSRYDQTLTLVTGDVVAGSAARDTSDTGINPVKIEIRQGGSVIATPFSETDGSTDWATWTWECPSSGDYDVRLEVKKDTSGSSYAALLVDNVTVTGAYTGSNVTPTQMALVLAFDTPVVLTGLGQHITPVQIAVDNSFQTPTFIIGNKITPVQLAVDNSFQVPTLNIGKKLTSEQFAVDNAFQVPALKIGNKVTAVQMAVAIEFLSPAFVNYPLVLITPKVTINSVDLSTSLTGIIIVTAREGEARLAEFSINPGAGTLDPYSYIGKAVTVDVDQVTPKRLFTGIVHLPKYDISTGLLHFICTDNLQEQFETSTHAAIDALIPGYWDESVFNEPAENWTYANQRISCYPGSFDKSFNGALRTTDWQAKENPDYTFTDATILDKTIDVGLAERRYITNSIKIKFSSRYERLWQRELTGSWTAPNMTPFANWLTNPWAMPTKTLATEAYSGWTLKDINFTDMPATGAYGGYNWILNEYGQELCQGISGTVATRWKQDVTDIYDITVSSAASITAHGLLEISREHSATSPKTEDFTDFKVYSAPLGTEIDAGNWILTNESSKSNAVLTAINQARTELLASHRSNTVSFSVPINADLDLIHTIYLNHPKLQAKGKCLGLTHTIDINAGTAITAVQLAIYLPNVESQTDTTITEPSSPYTNPTGLPNELPAQGTHLGNIADAPAQDEDWEGWVANYDSGPGTPIYTVGFSVNYPEIAENVAVEFTDTPTFSVAIPQDTFVIIK